MGGTGGRSWPHLVCGGWVEGVGTGIAEGGEARGTGGTDRSEQRSVARGMVLRRSLPRTGGTPVPHLSPGRLEVETRTPWDDLGDTGGTPVPPPLADPVCSRRADARE